MCQMSALGGMMPFSLTWEREAEEAPRLPEHALARHDRT